MSTFVYFPLAEPQIQYLKSCVSSQQTAKLMINKQQSVASTYEKTGGFAGLSLSTLQVQMLEHSKATKSDLTLEFHLHQLKEMAKMNWDIEMSIESASLCKQLKSGHIRKN